MFRLGGVLDKLHSVRVLCFKERQTQELLARGRAGGGGGGEAASREAAFSAGI